MAGAPLTPEERERIRALHAAGKSLHAIHQALGRSKSTISRACEQMGLTFDRARTAAAAKAVQTDAKALRASTSHRLLLKANELLDQMDAPHLVWNFGGRDNTYNEHTLDKPPTGDLRNLMSAAGTALDKHIALERVDTDSGVDAAKSVLGQLGEALQVAADQLNGTADAS